MDKPLGRGGQGEVSNSQPRVSYSLSLQQDGQGRMCSGSADSGADRDRFQPGLFCVLEHLKASEIKIAIL